MAETVRRDVIYGSYIVGNEPRDCPTDVMIVITDGNGKAESLAFSVEEFKQFIADCQSFVVSD